MTKKLTKEEFIERAKEVNKDENGEPLYDYTDVEYTGTHNKVAIRCPIHGIFYQTPHNHLKGNKCPYCAHKVKKTHEMYIEEVKDKHKDENGEPLYDYSITKFIDKKTPIQYICKKHGIITQLPYAHLGGRGCRYCAFERIRDKNRKSNEEFIAEAKEKCKDKNYTFEKTNYVTRITPIIVTCHEKDENGQEHGDFSILPSSLLEGYGCHKCGEIKQKTCNRKTNEQFIIDSIKVNGFKYDYSEVDYINKMTEVCLICHEKDSNGNEHGRFFVKPQYHLHGAGCPKCNESRLEREVRILLENNNIPYEYESGYKTFQWLGKMSLDFYLPQYNLAIECQGIQHFEYNSFLDSNETVMKRDEIKRKLCEENGVKLLYFSNLGIEYTYHVIEDKEELLNEILNNGSKI